MTTYRQSRLEEACIALLARPDAMLFGSVRKCGTGLSRITHVQAVPAGVGLYCITGPAGCDIVWQRAQIWDRPFLT